MTIEQDLELPMLSQAASTSEQAPEEPASKRRNYVARGDYASTQIFEPFKPCGIEEMNPASMFTMAEKGSRYVTHHSHFADVDPYRQGIAISQFAQLMKHVCDRFRSDRIKHMLRPELYARIKVVVDELYPHFEILDGGQLRRVVRGSSQLRASSLKPINDVEVAVKNVVQWLSKDKDPLRGFMAAFSCEGVTYAGQVEEKLARGYLLKVGSPAFLTAARMRLCQDASIIIKDDAAGLHD